MQGKCIETVQTIKVMNFTIFISSIHRFVDRLMSVTKVYRIQ